MTTELFQVWWIKVLSSYLFFTSRLFLIFICRRGVAEELFRALSEVYRSKSLLILPVYHRVSSTIFEGFSSLLNVHLPLSTQTWASQEDLMWVHPKLLVHLVLCPCYLKVFFCPYWRHLSVDLVDTRYLWLERPSCIRKVHLCTLSSSFWLLYRHQKLLVF